MAQFQVTQGTQTNLANDPVGTNVYPISKIDYGAAGASVLYTGTVLAVNSVANLVGGTVTALGKGTISTGTVDAISQFPPNQWQVNTTVGTSVLGTIKAAVSGSAIFVTDLVISAGTQTTVVLGMGGTSTPLMGTLSFAQFGGLVMNFKQPGSVTSGSALVYKQSADNTLTIFAQGFVR